MDLQKAVNAAAPGDTVRVPAGRYAVNLTLTRPVTLLASGQVVLDGQHRGCVVRVDCASGPVRLAGLTLVGGVADEAGGGLCVDAGEVDLSDCTLRFNKAPQYGGGGLYARAGRVTAVRCRFEANTGRQGGGVLVDGLAQVELRACTLIQNAALDGGGLRVKEGGKAKLVGCTVADNKVLGDAARGGALSLSATTTRSPSASLEACIVSERAEGPSCVFNDGGTLTLVHNLLPSWCAPFGGANTFGDAGFVGTGAEPYLPGETSAARRGVVSGTFTAGELDARGEPRDDTLGAFAWRPAGAPSLPY